MRLLRWTLGAAAIAAFLIADIVYLDAPLLIRLINILLFCSLFVLYRVMRGPSAADRIVAVEILGILIIGMLALIGLHEDMDFFLDIALIWALLSFVAALAFSKILEGRRLDD